MTSVVMIDTAPPQDILHTGLPHPSVSWRRLRLRELVFIVLLTILGSELLVFAYSGSLPWLIGTPFLSLLLGLLLGFAAPYIARYVLSEINLPESQGQYVLSEVDLPERLSAAQAACERAKKQLSAARKKRHALEHPDLAYVELPFPSVNFSGQSTEERLKNSLKNRLHAQEQLAAARKERQEIERNECLVNHTTE